MKTIKQSSSNNIFQTVIRKVVREELETVETRLVKTLDERIDEKLENTFRKFRDEIMVGIDQITGMFKKHEEEHEILSGQHKRLIDIEEKVEVLEKIHPQSRHLAV